jgi:O-antigen ligase
MRSERLITTRPDPLPLLDIIAAFLLLLAAMLSPLDSFRENQHEMIPLVAGLVLLLASHSKEQPIKIAYLMLLMFAMRIYLHSDERYGPNEITLSDYILLISSCAAGFRLKAGFWKLFLPLTAIYVPLTGCLALYLHNLYTVNENFAAGNLSINQTAFLFGACLTLSLSFLWNAISQQRAWPKRPLLAMAWLLISMLTIFLILQTKSRAGLGIPVVSLLLLLLFGHGKQITAAIDSSLSRWAPNLHPRRLRFLLMGMTVGLTATVAGTILYKIYSIQQNRVSDLHRLYLLRCYFSTMFTGNNRLIYGMGFTRASDDLCKDVGIIEGTTHAHNIYAQVAADNGLFALLLLVGITVLLLRVGASRLEQIDHPLILASLTLSLYCFFFFLVEGGWAKVSFLQAFIGMALGSMTMHLPKKLNEENYNLKSS